MKRTVVCIVCLILAALLLAVLPICGEEQIYDDVLRLHVLAATDTAKDQAEKLAVRDAILQEFGAYFTSASSVAEAAEQVAAHMDEIRATANRALVSSGSGHTVRAELVRESFDRRKYGDRTLPAGTYLSLQITIDRGEGQNWWCVLYPPLCTEAALGGSIPEDPGEFSPGEEKLITGNYVIRFRILEVLESIFGE